MTHEIRFGEFIHEINIHQDTISYNALTPKVKTDSEGNVIPFSPKKIKVKAKEAFLILEQYVGVRLVEQIKAVVPLAIYLCLFQALILRQTIADSAVITAGLMAVIIGLMLFMEGLKVGLMPLGHTLGSSLPKKSKLPTVLFIAFLLGIGVTLAEPAIGALKAAGQIVDIHKAPYLYALLNFYSNTLVTFVGIGVGIAAVLGTTRFLYGWSLKTLIYLTLIPTTLLSLYLASSPELAKILGLAWDCGAVTTGPVTVPLVLSLGIGIAATGGKNHSSLSGFGIVTLASLFPIIAVMSLALFISLTITPEQIFSLNQHASHIASTATVPWYKQTPAAETIAGLRALVPLIIFLLLILYFILKEKLHRPGYKTYGLILAISGMILFNLGLTYGLSKLGSQSGGIIPGAFMHLEHMKNSPLYNFSLGLSIALLFAFILGFGATLAEPALNALGLTVENLSNGAFKKKTLMYAVSTGVSFGIALGVVKIIFDIPLIYLIIPCYSLGILLTYLSTEEFVNVAWDSAGVTTGPVTVPLVLSMGLGFGHAVGAIEGFGILSMASIGPIIAVLLTGLAIQWRIKRDHQMIDSKLEPLEGSK